jgi:peptidoglycan L-alanyl-D-glutamate endopeptidase CwlK
VPLAELISDYIDLYEAKLRAHKNFAHFKTGFLRRVNKLRLESDKWLAEQGTTITAIPTPKIEDGEAPVTPQTNELIEILIRTLGGASSGQPQIPAAPPAPGAPTPPAPQAMNLADMLRDLAERLSPSTDTVRPDSAAGGVVTPVNGALGQTIGKALDGKKSALGIIGALASALFTPTAAVTAGTAAPELSSPLGAILPAVIGSAGQSVAPFLMPISLALTAWGAFGKLDKYFRSKK